MFKVGDYVMGTNRTYKRSLYRVHKILNSELFDLQFITLNGIVGRPDEISPAREMSTFAIATPFEITAAHGVIHQKALLDLLWRLDVMKSYPEQL